MEDQFLKLPFLLKDIAYEFCRLSATVGVDPVVTRVADPVDGESGVHPAYRAIDFRDERGSVRLYKPQDVMMINTELNKLYQRTDGYKVCLHHGFAGGPEHFHLQVSWSEKNHVRRA